MLVIFWAQSITFLLSYTKVASSFPLSIFGASVFTEKFSALLLSNRKVIESSQVCHQIRIQSIINEMFLNKDYLTYLYTPGNWFYENNSDSSFWEPRLASPLITKASKVKLSIHPLLLFGSKPNSVKKPRSFHGCTAITSFGPNFTGLGTLKSALFTAFCSWVLRSLTAVRLYAAVHLYFTMRKIEYTSCFEAQGLKSSEIVFF